MKKISRIVLLAAAISLAPFSASAGPELVKIQVGYGAGGGFDLSARLVANHLGQYLPGNPEVVVENVPGAGSLKLANLLAKASPTDGSVVGVITPSISQASIFKPDADPIDATAFNWIASFRSTPSYCIVANSTGVETFEDFIKADIKVGASGKGSATYLLAAMVKNIFNANFDIITGYKGGADINLAIERDEVQARCGFSLASFTTSSLASIAKPIIKLHTEEGGEAPGVPLLRDFITDDIDIAAANWVLRINQFYFPVVMPPNTPDDIVATYRDAYEQVWNDPDFRNDVEKAGQIYYFRRGEEVQQMVENITNVDEAVAERVAEIVK